jgi:hypothetical protein
MKRFCFLERVAEIQAIRCIKLLTVHKHDLIGLKLGNFALSKTTGRGRMG